MVRAPPSYAIVGADVDSEELWISSVMGDSQFGTQQGHRDRLDDPRGTKSAGTDLHSKTANILNISRDGAKVFNYSRIWCRQAACHPAASPGRRQAVEEDADDLATNLYKQTKAPRLWWEKGSARQDELPLARRL
jgi:DNA polymerase gamma 1